MKEVSTSSAGVDISNFIVFRNSANGDVCSRCFYWYVWRNIWGLAGTIIFAEFWSVYLRSVDIKSDWSHISAAEDISEDCDSSLISILY